MARFRVSEPTAKEIRENPIYKLPDRMRKLSWKLEDVFQDDRGELTDQEIEVLHQIQDRLHHDAFVLEGAFLAVGIHVDPKKDSDIEIEFQRTEKSIAKQKDQDLKRIERAAKALGFEIYFGDDIKKKLHQQGLEKGRTNEKENQKREATVPTVN